MFWHLVGTENIAQNDTESGDTEIKDLVMILKICNMVTIWIYRTRREKGKEWNPEENQHRRHGQRKRGST